MHDLPLQATDGSRAVTTNMPKHRRDMEADSHVNYFSTVRQFALLPFYHNAGLINAPLGPGLATQSAQGSSTRCPEYASAALYCTVFLYIVTPTSMRSTALNFNRLAMLYHNYCIVPHSIRLHCKGFRFMSPCPQHSKAPRS